MLNKQNPIKVRNEAEEYQQVRRDLVKVLILNGIFLAILLGLFFLNRTGGKVDQFFAKILKF